jgi:hypothetical protein
MHGHDEPSQFSDSLECLTSVQEAKQNQALKVSERIQK